MSTNSVPTNDVSQTDATSVSSTSDPLISSTAPVITRRLPVFNPGIQSDSELVATFVARRNVFARIIDDLTNETETSRAQSHLIIGQRGMGKTTLLLRIAIELRSNQYRDRFIGLTFAEEQYSVDRLSKLWLNCLDAMASAAEKANDKATAATIDAIVDRFDSSTHRTTRANDSVLANDVLQEVMRLAGNRRLVLLVDNVQLVFDRLGHVEQHALREALMRPGGPIFVAAAPAPVLQTQDYGAPFYDQFKTHYLSALSSDEMRDLLCELARLANRPDVVSNVTSHSARVKTLHALTGGNPRAVVMLFHLYLEGLSKNVYSDLEGVLDLVTPLYKARFEEFPPQMQVIAAAIAEHWDPCTAREIAEETSLGTNQIQQQLDRLYGLGFIEPVELSDDAVRGWQIGERFFNVWYLMRLATRRRRRGIEFLTRFLEAFFEPPEREQFARDVLTQRSANSDHLLVAASVADSVCDPALKDDVRRHVELSALQIEARDARLKMEQLLGLADLSAATLQFDELRRKLESLAGTTDKTAAQEFADRLLGNRELVFRRELPKLAAKKSLTGEERATLIDACDLQRRSDIEMYGSETTDWLAGRLRTGQVRTVDDIEDWTRTISLAKAECPNALRLIWESWPDELFRQLSESYVDVLYNFVVPTRGSNKDIGRNWFALGYQCAERQLAKQSEAAYREAIVRNFKPAWCWNNLGIVLKKHLGLYEESETAFRKAIELDPKDADPWNGLSNLLQDYLGRYEESEAAYRKAIELDPKDADPWNGLGNLLNNHLGRYEESEAAYRKAIELDPKGAYLWNGLGNLLQDHLERFEESEAAYRKAIELDPAYSNAWNSLGNLLCDCLADYEQAESCYRESVRLEPTNTSPQLNHIFLLRDFRGNTSAALQLWRELDYTNWTESLDVVHLQEALFAAYDANWGIAARELQLALNQLSNGLPPSTRDDWERTASVLIHLNYGAEYLSLLEEHGTHQQLRPYFEAVRIAHLGNPKLLRDLAPEVRRPTEEIYKQIQTRLDKLPESTRRRVMPTPKKISRRKKRQ